MSKKLRYALTGQNGDVGSILFNKFLQNAQNCVCFEEDKKGIDVLIHMAAKSPPSSNDEIVNSNIIYLQKIAKQAKQNDVKSIIFFSAMSIYGEQNKESLSEIDSVNNPSFYGLSKLIGEKYLSDSGIKTMSLRLPAILGYKNKTNFLARIYEKCVKNEDIEINNSDRYFNNFISVSSIYDFIQNLNFYHEFDAINLASRLDLKVIEICELIKEQTNSSSKIVALGGKSNFFNISTQKAELEYRFMSQEAKSTIINWIAERIKYERS